MSVEYINYTLSQLQLSSLKIFYDFDSFSGDYINSVGSGDSLYSGEILNKTAAFTGESSGSGFFNGEYISVQNHTGITSKNFTLLFSQEKTGVSPGVVFSTIDENGPSGCEVGINSANNLYYKNFINGSPNYKTLPSYSANKNIYSVSVSANGDVNLGRVNFGKPVEKPFPYRIFTPANYVQYYNLDKATQAVAANSISNGSSMNIGSGEFAYKGFLDYFLYFDDILNDSIIRRLASSLYGELNITEPVTGFNSGFITGYAITSGTVSGEVGTTVYSTGSFGDSGSYTFESGEAVTGAVGISGVIYFPYTGITQEEDQSSQFLSQTLYKKITNLSFTHTLTGAPEVGTLSDYQTSGSYWHFSGNSGTYYGSSATGASGTLFGITGFNLVTLTGYMTGITGEMYGHSGNSGDLYNTFTYSGIRSSGNSYIQTGEQLTFRSLKDESYFPRSLSMIGPTNPRFFYEILYDISGQENTNQTASIVDNYEYGIFVASRTGSQGAEQTQAAFNGVSMFTGSPTYSINQFNIKSISVDTGFMASGVNLFTEVQLATSDEITYDTVPSGDKESLVVSSLGDYVSAPFAEISLDRNIFFNGVKLISGIDFINNGGFYPSGNITGATGLYFTYPKYGDQKDVTGSGVTPLTVIGYGLNPNGYVAFYNGIRQPEGGIIEHSSTNDLISGTTTLQNTSIVYKMANGAEQELL